MPTAVLTRTTHRGTIELAVSDRTAAGAGVARDADWGREHRPDPLSEWRERLRRMDEAEKRRETRRRRREAPLTDTGGSAGAVVAAFPLDPDEVAIEARRGGKAKTGGKRPAGPPPDPHAGRWFLGCCAERRRRERGRPGYGSAPAAKGPA